MPGSETVSAKPRAAVPPGGAPAHTAEDCLAKYAELCEKLAEFQANVRAIYSKEITCGAGCFFCCRTRLAVFPIEAEMIRGGARAMPAEALAKLRERLDNDWGPLAEYCPFLVEGACSIYAHRPLLCRIHGLPSSSKTYPEGTVDFCELNFKDFDVDRIDPRAVLDWDHMSHLLALLNFKFAQERGRDARGRLRIPLLELAREAAGLPPDTSDRTEPTS